MFVGEILTKHRRGLLLFAASWYN